VKVQAYAAELVGTFLFLGIGYLSVAAAGAAGVPPLLVVPFSFPLGLLAAIYAFGHISGGHFNPAVTIAMAIDRRTTPIDTVGYIVAQVVGALAAGALVLLAFDQATVAAGITAPNAEAGVTDIEAVILEAVLTAGFLLVILTASKRAGAMAALAIPLTLVAIHFAVAPLTGASVNPARSIGSAVLGGDMTALLIYLVGPIVGAILGWGIYRGAEAVGESTAAT
jgi:MIP family channel proteins